DGRPDRFRRRPVGAPPLQAPPAADADGRLPGGGADGPFLLGLHRLPGEPRRTTAAAADAADARPDAGVGRVGRVRGGTVAWQGAPVAARRARTLPRLTWGVRVTSAGRPTAR